MAKWTDAQGVYHDTDNLEYGNQGDTRYWSGTPGAVGSQSYDRPKDQSGAQVNYTVTNPQLPSITATTPAGPGAGYDMSKGFQPLPNGKTYGSLAEALTDLLGLKQSSSVLSAASGALPQTANGLSVNKPQAVQTTRMAGIPHGDASLNDTVYSEIAARAWAQAKGVSLEQARVELQNPTNAAQKQFLVQSASNGTLDYLAPELSGSQQTATGTAGQAGTATGGWDDYVKAKLEADRQAQEAEKLKAERDWQIAQNADERAQAALEIQQANQKLVENKYETDKQNYATNLMQQMLSTASSLRGPRNYAQFMQFSRGAQDLLSQLFGDKALAAFTAPLGGLDSATYGGLMADLGIGTGGTAATTGTTQVPLPYQISPAVWDSLGTTGQQMVLSAAEAAGYDPTEFVSQINSARPTGTASRRTQYSFARAA